MQLDWLNILGYILGVVAVGLLGMVSTYLVSWLKTKKQEVLSKTKSDTAQKYLDLLDKTIYECVQATNQTLVNDMKEAGTFDGDAQKQAFQQTYDAVLSVLTDEAQKCLSESVKDLGASIMNKIEAQISINHQ